MEPKSLVLRTSAIYYFLRSNLSVPVRVFCLLFLVPSWCPLFFLFMKNSIEFATMSHGTSLQGNQWRIGNFLENAVSERHNCNTQKSKNATKRSS